MKRHLVMAACIALIASPSTVLAQVSPSPIASPQSENPALSAPAKAFYASLVAGTPDRSHISADLNKALTDALVKTLSQQLTALGDPTWTFLRIKTSGEGPIIQYKLTYSSGAAVYYSYGVTGEGTVFAAFLGNSDL